MEVRKRSADGALPAASGGAKRAKSDGNEDTSHLSSGEREGDDQDRGKERGAGEASHVSTRRGGGDKETKKRGEKVAVDPEEELMRALEEDIEVEVAAVERSGGTAAVPADEDDDYDESDDESEDSEEHRGVQSNSTS